MRLLHHSSNRCQGACHQHIGAAGVPDWDAAVWHVDLHEQPPCSICTLQCYMPVYSRFAPYTPHQRQHVCMAHHVVTFCTALLAASEADTRCTVIVRSGGGLALPCTKRHMSFMCKLRMYCPAYISSVSAATGRSVGPCLPEVVSYCFFISVYLLLQGGCLKHVAVVMRLQRQKVLCEHVPPLCNKG